METTVKSYIYSLPNSGNMAWEYNPFHNYQTSVDIYEKEGYYIPDGQAINRLNGELLTKNVKDIKNDIPLWIDKRGNYIPAKNVISIDKNSDKLFAKAGSLLDLDTNQLKFDLHHPVDIQIQPSYDGSVNLILNDDKNIPRLINSRFSTREKNTYEIVDRIGENDTNIYSSESFDKDTSLYFQYESNPTIKYQGFIKGILPVGQYCFYLTYCDADDNESDYIAESGLIPVFLGSDGNPDSIDGGIKNQISDKGIKIKISNLDSSYNYLKVYYVRYFADYQQNRVFECKKIYRKYPINSGIMYLQITGNEEAEDMDANILNITRFNPKSILTSAQCKNMLFFGNIVKNMDNYRELSDLALRIIPSISNDKLENVSNDYETNNGSGYYSTLNIYNKTGYFDQEYYRFGVVFIYQNGTLSNVYNTLGLELTKDNDQLEYTPSTIYNEISQGDEVIATSRKYITVDDYGWIKNKSDFFYNSSLDLNARGVCKLNYKVTDNDTILGINFKIPEEVIKYLKTELGIRGLFFVRQKCIPNILAQCYLMPMDKILEAPVIQKGEDYYTECFLSQQDREIVNSYALRRYTFKKNSGESPVSETAYAAICPDFLLNQPYYNQIFNGSKFRLEQISKKESSDLQNEGGRNYFVKDNVELKNSDVKTQVQIVSVTEAVPTVAIKDNIFRTEIGKAEEVYRFRAVEIDTTTYDAGKKTKNNELVTDEVDKATNLVRGIYSPYLAVYSSKKLETNCLYNIYSDLYNSEKQEYQTRMDSSEPFYAISDRLNFSQLSGSSDKELVCWRGDCYINTFTYRLNRNFNDPSLPNNDVIIDPETWKNNYTVSDQTKWDDISRSDVNAIQMGQWITFKVRSSMNYALRSEDHSFVSEEALMGAPRSFYPKSHLMYRGENKLPDSYLYNDAYRATLGYKCYFTLQDINYLKNVFSNRIQYSAIAIQDSFKNNYRYSLSTYFRDYSAEYGGITKLIGFEGYLLVVFEHAIGLAVINERILQQSEGEPVFINTGNVLPEELTIISDTLGSQWAESVIKTEMGYVYGVDTVNKKIWRVKGQQVEVISDFRVNKFLVDNISLGERELEPFIGIKNVKTHYNNNKKDVMFTFYDDIYQDEEKVWNLCFNELMYSGNQNSGFTTFYSWIPSYSENIDTQYFSFDRNTSKKLALLSKSNYNIPENSGVLLDPPIFDANTKDDEINGIEAGYSSLRLRYVHPTFGDITDKVTFEFEKDHWKNYELFDDINNDNKLSVNDEKRFEFEERLQNQQVLLLVVKPIIKNDYIEDKFYKVISESKYFLPETIAVSARWIINGDEDKKLTTDFYIHGRSGIVDIKENIYPCYWYGEQHPFEFEFVVNDNVAQQKIFNNLLIIGNKAVPESFHFEIEGDNYDWSKDKRNMYYRQERTKEWKQQEGSDILYNRKFEDVKKPKYNFNPMKDYIQKTIEDKVNYDYTYYNKDYQSYSELQMNKKSTLFPLYYDRIDTYNDIYHNYQLTHLNNMDYENLSGSEISWNRDLNQFNVITHVKNSPVDRVGTLRGNSYYKEGKWNIQIPTIKYIQKNETDSDWQDSVPPIIKGSIASYNGQGQVFYDGWSSRKETRIRDKWIKIRVRYSGKELAIIQALITLYNLSYA